MPNPFLRHLEGWLPFVLREKAIASARDDRLLILGASDLARMLSDYVLTRLIENPTACWTACELDAVTDRQIIDTIQVASDVLAAGFIGAMIELTPWQGDEGLDFLRVHGVPADDAREFCAAVDVVAEKLALRGQMIIRTLDESTPLAPSPQPETASSWRSARAVS